MTRLSNFLERLLDNENRTVDRIEVCVVMLVIAYFVAQVVRVGL